MALDEQDVAGEDGPVFGDMDHRIAAGMSRADIDEFKSLGTQAQAQLPVERSRRQCRHDACPIEFGRSHQVAEKFGAFAELRRFGHHAGHHRGVLGLHLLEARLGCDDLRAFHELIAEGVIGIGMRVDERADLFAIRHLAAHLVEHRAGKLEIHQRVDEQ